MIDYYIVNSTYKNYLVILVLAIFALILTIVARLFFEVFGYERKARKIAEERANRSLKKLSKIKNKLSHERDRLNAILSAMGEGLIVTNELGEILLINQAAGIYLRVSTADAIGKYIFDLISTYHYNPINGHKKNIDFVRLALTESDIINFTSFDKAICKNNVGQEFPISITATPFERDFKHRGVIVLFKDASKELEIARAKNEFVSIASHQLRTPLSIIRWYAELLFEEYKIKKNKKLFKMVDEIKIGVLRTIKLVNDLLNTSRIELGTFPISSIDFNYSSAIKSILKELVSKIKDKKIKIKFLANKNIPLILADPNLANLILHNIITNAIKYTPARGNVTIELKVDGLNNGSSNKYLFIIISDNGCGIPIDEQHKIFEKMFRASNAVSSEAEGTGLGLYVVKSIIDHVGGKIWFKSPIYKSKKNPGTRFFIRLPLSGMKSKTGSKKLIYNT